MSMPAAPSPGGGQASASDINSTLQGIVRQLSAWVKAFQGRVSTGTFTMAAAATTTVAQPNVASNSNIILTPYNAAAATLVGSAKSPYIQSINPGVGFVVATSSGSAVGSEQFSYQVTTPG